MQWIDYGLLGFQRSFIEKSVPEQKTMDLSEILCESSKNKKIFGVSVQKRFYEIGSLKGLADFTKYIEEKWDFQT